MHEIHPVTPASAVVSEKKCPAWWVRTAPCALLLVVTALGYITADHEQFLFDSDQPALLANPARNGLETVRQFWRDPLRPGQQLTYVSFALNHALNRAAGLDGLDVTGFLAFNVLLHGINACLVYLLLRALLRQIEPDREPSIWIPAALALLFAVHPVHTASVSYIIQRRGLLAATFYLLAILAWLGARRRWMQRKSSPASASLLAPVLLVAATLVCYWLAYRSKNVALTLPLILLLVEFCLRARGWSSRRYLGWLLGGVILYVACMFAGLWAIGRFQPASLALTAYGEPVDWGVGAHFLTMCRALLQYWKLLLLPWPGWLCLDHDLALSRSLSEHGAALALAIHVALLTAAFLAIRRGFLLGGLGIIFFYAVQIPYMLLPQWEFLVEYKAYLPSIGIVLILAQICLLLRHRAPAGALLVSLTIIALLFLPATLQRNMIYRSPYAFWSDAAAKAPQKFRPAAGLADALAREGRYPEAFEAFARAARLADADKSVAGTWRSHNIHHNFGWALMKAGKLREAVQEFIAAAKLDPRDAGTMESLGNAYTRLGELDAAIYHYDLALKLDPSSANLHLFMANALAAKRQMDQAEQHYREAIRLNPKSAAAHSSLAKVLTFQNRMEEALGLYQQALQIDPKFAEAHKSLADVQYRLRHKSEAIAHYRLAIELDPAYPEACNNLANVLTVEGGMEAEALDLYMRAVKIKPDYVLARENLADMLLKVGRSDDAMREYQQVLVYQPDHARVRGKLAAASRPAQ